MKPSSLLTILKTPTQRQRYIKNLLVLDGLTEIVEDPKAAYCALSLTSTPPNLITAIEKKQTMLKAILQKAGLTAYDPGTSPFSPHLGLSFGPEEVYRVDKGKVLSARFFVSHDVLPSTGVGVEYETARVYNRISVILHDKKNRTSRMQPNRTIHLMYTDFARQEKEFIAVFRYLQNFEPGIGLDNGIPVLLGFTKNNKIVNLEKEIYAKFPSLQYLYDGTVPNAKLLCENDTIFS